MVIPQKSHAPTPPSTPPLNGYVYEPLFHRHSYGFRRGKSAHQALGRLVSVINARKKKCVVVEMDIEKFFNSVDHEWLLQKLKLKLKIADPHFLRLISRMLRGSILHEDGSLAESERGTPQGSPVSPMLANICLHHLLDGWFDAEFAGQGEFVRYADDAVFVFTDEAVAQRFQTALQTRLAEAGLSLNLAKSAIVPFSSVAPQGFVSFLGYDFYWVSVRPTAPSSRARETGGRGRPDGWTQRGDGSRAGGSGRQTRRARR